MVKPIPFRSSRQIMEKKLADLRAEVTRIESLTAEIKALEIAIAGHQEPHA